MEERNLTDVSNKLNVLISLALRQLVGDKDFSDTSKRKSGVGDMARYLSDMGIDAKDIAGILGAPVQSVRTLLTPNRRK